MLTDPKAAKVRGVAKLNKKDARIESGLFLLEGPQGFKEALNEPELITEVFATEEAIDRYSAEFARAEEAGIEVQLVTEQVLKVLTDTTTPQGIVAICRQVDVTLDEIIEVKPQLIALLANIRDPGNAGTVLRAADASGADAVIFSANSVDLYNTKVVRSTTGSLFHVPTALDVDIAEAITKLKAAGMQVFAANGRGDNLPDIDKAILAKPTVWVFGNEAWGFEPSTLELVDREVAVPIYGAAESLNLATAASVCLYASAFAQQR